MKRIKIGLERTLREFVEVVVEVPDDFDESDQAELSKTELGQQLYYEFGGELDWEPTKWYGDDIEQYDDVVTLTDDEPTDFVWDGKKFKEA